MRARAVFEKFEEQSDPVSDMGVGGFTLRDAHKKIENTAAKQWIKFLKDNLEDRIIKTLMMKWEHTGHTWRTFEIFVKRVVNDNERYGFEPEVTVQDNEDKYYTLSSEDKIYIIR